jgi:hypothetical protein
MEEKEIAKIKKNSQETVIVALQNYKGKELLSIRSWVNPGMMGNADFIPTKKGINISIILIDELISALNKAKEEISSAK